MDEEELLKMRSADRAAGTMFNVFPQGVLQSVGRAIQRTFANPQSSTMMAGSAGVNPLVANNVPEFPRLGPLVRTDYGLPPSERPDWRNPADQWDARPVKSAPTQFAGTNPRAATADDIAFFYGRGKYAPAGQVQQTVAEAPQPAASPNANKLPIQTPYGMVYASNKTPEGGGPSQAMSDRVTEMGGLPAQSARLENIGEQAQRSAAIAQMRERGAALAQQRFGAQESFFAQRRAERDALRSTEATARAGGTRPMDIMKARELVAGPSTIAGIQQQATIGPMSPVGTTVSRFAGALPEGGSRPLPSGAMGASGYALAEQMQAARRALGATGPYSNAGAERRKRNRQGSQARGFQAPYSTGAQEAFEKYLRRQNEA